MIDFNEILRYDKNTGKLFWKVSPSRKMKVGDEAGCLNSRGAVEIIYKGKQYRAHRVIWEMVYGEPPKNTIDHIDGNPSNNRLENLRDVSHAENRRNNKVSKANRSGVSGVRACPSCDGYWVVTIGKQYIGYFDDFDKAVGARQIAEEIYGYHENNGKR
jgi:hypothetical protein